MDEILRRSPHQQRVDEFMVKAQQEVPSSPVLPDAKTRELRAKLILEEALETVRELGFDLVVSNMHDDETADITEKTILHEKTKLTPNGRENLDGIADGCADIIVVTTGTLSACGIADDSLQREVDVNNLEKFGPGHWWREDGKLMKPKHHKPPRIHEVLEAQTCAACDRNKECEGSEAKTVKMEVPNGD